MIIVSGDSWSDPKFRSQEYPTYDCSFPKWYDLLNTRKNVLSIGKAGESNSYICKSVIKRIKEDPDITEVYVALTDWMRHTIWGKKINPQLSFFAEKTNILSEAQLRNTRDQEAYVNIPKFNRYDMIHWGIEDTLINLHALIDVCENNNIRLHVFQMLKVCGMPNNLDKRFWEHMFNHPLFMLLSEKSNMLYGYPFLEFLGGETMDDLIKNNGNIKLRIGEADMHPNADGHALIAERINRYVAAAKV